MLRLVSKTHKELIKLNTPKTKNPVKNWAETFQTFLQRRHTNGPQTHKKMLKSLGIREINIKTTMRYHLTPVRMAKINNSGHNRCWQR